MTAFLAWLKGSKFVVYLTMAFAAVLTFLGAYLKGKGAGKAQATAKAQKKVIENVEKARRSERDTATADPDEFGKLRKRYTRK